MNFTALELCSIIKACGEAGVRELSMGELHLTFGKPPNTPETVSKTEPEAPANPAVATLTESQHEKLTADAVESQEILKREREIAELMITDPLAAEQLISQGELTTDGR